MKNEYAVVEVLEKEASVTLHCDQKKALDWAVRSALEGGEVSEEAIRRDFEHKGFTVIDDPDWKIYLTTAEERE